VLVGMFDNSFMEFSDCY